MNALEERYTRLSDQQRQLLAKKLSKLASAKVKQQLEQTQRGDSSSPIEAAVSSRTKLVAYFTFGGDQLQTASNKKDFTAQLQSYLVQQLPAHQRPSVLIALDEFPRLPNGKVSVADLPVNAIHHATAPHREADIESSKADDSSLGDSGFSALASILGGLLGMQDIRPSDNFFELGGDSITAIQFVSKAREAGFNLDIRSLTAANDLAELASIGQAVSDSVGITPDIATGPVPLTPIQHWFFSQHHAKPAHWNLAGRIDIQKSVDSELLQRAIVECLRAHPALGTRFIFEQGVWQAIVPDQGPPHDLVVNYPLVDSSSQEQLQDQLSELQSSFDLQHGWMIRFLIQSDKNGSNTVLSWVAHHLIIDAISIDVMVADIESRYKKLCRQEQSNAVSENSLSLRGWAIALSELANELANGRGEHNRDAEMLNVNDMQLSDGQLISSTAYNQSIVSTEADVVDVEFSIDSVQTADFLAANDVFKTKTAELLVIALSEAWLKVNKSTQLLIDIESHGRDMLPHDHDASGTIGWLTSFHPVAIDVSSAPELNDRIKTVKESLREAAKHSKYSLLQRFSTVQTNTDVAKVPLAPILINFMGQSTAAANPTTTGNWQNHSIIERFLRHPENRLSYPIEVNIYITNGCINWFFRFSELHISKQQIDSFCSLLQDEIQQIISESTAQPSSAFTPSDFPGLQMDQGELDSFLSSMSASSTDEDA